jgi:anti-sigma factor RsiW
MTEAERVTAYVDGALDETESLALERLMAERPDLRAQLEEEKALRDRLRSLPLPEPRPGFEARVLASVRRERRPSRTRYLLPLAAALFLAAWLRGLPGFVSFEVARDHSKCFAKATLPAKIWSDDPAEVTAWFEKQGTRMPVLPAGTAHLTLVGARYCPLGDRSAAHVYYAAQGGHLSLFVVPGPVRFDDRYDREVWGRHVRFVRTAGTTVALVSEEPEIVKAFAREFSRSLALADGPAR